MLIVFHCHGNLLQTARQCVAYFNWIINLWDWAFTKWCNLRWLRILSLFSYYIWPHVFCIIFTFHPARSAGLKKDALWCQQFSRLWASNKLYNPRCSRSPLPPTDISSRQKAACRASFGILLWANLSWFWEAGGPLTPARRLSLRYLPAACCHGYLGSVAGRCSSIEIYDTTPFTKHQCFLCCCHHKPAWCLLLAPPSATEISSLSGTARWKRHKRLACAYVCAGNFANGILFTPSDHLQPNYSPLWHLYLWAIRPDGFQQEGSNSVVNVSLEGCFKILRKKSQTLVEMEIMQMFWKGSLINSFDLFTSYFLLILYIFSRACTLKEKKMRNEATFLWLSWIEQTDRQQNDWSSEAVHAEVHSNNYHIKTRWNTNRKRMCWHAIAYLDNEVRSYFKSFRSLCVVVGHRKEIGESCSD